MGAKQATDKELLKELKNAGVISDGKIYRMRLFSKTERSNLRRAIGSSTKKFSMGIHDGCTGMMDELEMVRWETYGRDKLDHYLSER